ncbi:MAG: E3 binding domain-containing protein [Myxococcota bacterium]
MPAVRKLLFRNGLVASDVRGTGPKGRHPQGGRPAATASRAPRLPRSSAAAAPAASARPPSAPAPAADDARTKELVPMSKLRQTIARRLRRGPAHCRYPRRPSTRST